MELHRDNRNRMALKHQEMSRFSHLESHPCQQCYNVLSVSTLFSGSYVSDYLQLKLGCHDFSKDIFMKCFVNIVICVGVVVMNNLKFYS